MKIQLTQRIHFYLHTPGKFKRLGIVLFVISFIAIGKYIGWPGQLGFAIVFILGTLRTPAPVKEKATAAHTGPAPEPEDLEIHFISNTLAPAGWKQKYPTDTPEGQQKFLASYWKKLQAGEYGGYQSKK
jgi:hypothetical protein